MTLKEFADLVSDMRDSQKDITLDSPNELYQIKWAAERKVDEALAEINNISVVRKNRN